MKDDCGNCRYFHKGYRLQGFGVPASCVREFHTVGETDPACAQHEARRIDGD